MENTFFEAPEFPVLDKFKKSMVQFLKYSMALLATIVFIKVLEYTYVAIKAQIPSGFWALSITSLFYDIIFFLKSLPILYLLFLLFFFSLKVKKHIYISIGVVFSIYILIYLFLLKYFFTSLVPLGADFYGYSYNDMKYALSAALSIDVLTLLIFILPFIGLWWALRFSEKINFLNFRIAAGVLVIALFLWYFKVSALPSAGAFNTNYSYNVAVNKQAFFFENSYVYFFDSEPDIDIYAANYLDDEDYPAKPRLVYTDHNYPFLREDHTEEVLGNFFDVNPAQRPNIVFIQVKGLGRAFSGPNAYLGSFTPFLDRLRTQSLYFENFLASHDQTSMAFPSILSSLSYDAQDIANWGERVPKTVNIINLLKYNGYHVSFISGTDFANESAYVKAQGADQIIAKTNFGKKQDLYSSYWGYPDLEVVEKAIKYYEKLPHRPFFSYIQTFSMRTPYKVPNMEKYYSLFETHMNKLGFNEQQKSTHRKYKNQYATVLYTDEALKYFFQEVAKQPSFYQTIFILTGDRRLSEIPASTEIDKYHVPLMVYSPMLKRPESIRSISSHLDITPSLVKFLQANYGINAPTLTTWVGTGLDTVKQFRNIHNYPLRPPSGYISRDYFLSHQTLYHIEDHLTLALAEEPDKKAQLLNSLNEYRLKNNQAMESLQLMPDSIYKKYGR